MLFKIKHITNYRYSRPVTLGPHWIRMRPFSNGVQRVVSFEQTVSPRPAGESECVDLFGNAATRIWFDEPVPSLTVTVEFVVKTERENAYDYLLPPAERLRLPLRYAPEEEAATLPYLLRRHSHPAVTAFAEAVAKDARHDAARFLTVLNDTINSRCRHYIREEGEPFAPERTLEECGGSCRDLAVLFVEACRSVGIAARFASGYLQADPVRDRRYLHAWAEAYLSEAGWRGYDPSHRVAVADRHVLVAVGASPQHATPILGSFWGYDVTAEMRARIDMSTHETVTRSQEVS